MSHFNAWLWLSLSIPPLLLLQGWITRHMQIIWLLLVRHDQMAIWLNQLVFLPGVVLHETSHWLMARLLGARTVGFSVLPVRQPDGKLRLGYVQTERVDFLREALIGIAPLLTGTAAVVLIGQSRLAVGGLGAAIAAGDLGLTLQLIGSELNTSDLYVWLYLLFTLSNTMLPSGSDRRAWPAVGILLLLVGVGLYFLGLGPLVQDSFGELLAAGVRVMASAFTITIAIDLLMVPLIYGAEWLLWQLVGPTLTNR